MTFPKINKQARGIAALYTWLGLISIPVLTIVTIISVSNVFTRGQLAQASWIETTWAIIFAAAIEVNIVRLFFESRLNKDRGAFWLGVGLVFVAGIALTIEGLQQSIGFNWSNYYVQVVVGFVVGLRVLVVVLLLAREGSRLGTTILQTEQEYEPIYACLVHFPEPKPEPLAEQIPEQEPECETEQDAEQNMIPFPNTAKRKALQPIERQVQRWHTKYPNMTYAEIGQKVGRSKTTVSNILKRLAEQDKLAKEA